MVGEVGGASYTYSASAISGGSVNKSLRSVKSTFASFFCCRMKTQIVRVTPRREPMLIQGTSLNGESLRRRIGYGKQGAQGEENGRKCAECAARQNFLRGGGG